VEVDSGVLGVILSVAIAGSALAILLQLVDVVTGHQVRRAGRAAGTRDRDRVLSWAIAVCSIVLVLLVLGVDLAVRLLLDRGQLLGGLLALVGLVAVAAVTALIAARALRRPETGYRVIREELRAQSGTRLSKGRIADYRTWLAAIDDRQNDLRRHVVAGRWVRAIPVVVALAALVAAVWLAAEGTAPWWEAAICLVLVVVSVWFAIWGARISLARNLAIHAVHQKQRAEALLVLDDLERKAPRKVAGLSERVSRALAILREQQGQSHEPGEPRPQNR
jgi:membrane protein YdbS with pleckstrin-like domain